MLLIRDFPEAFYEPSRSGIAIKNYKNSYIRNFLRDETFLRNEARRILLDDFTIKKGLHPTEDDVYNEMMEHINNTKETSDIFYGSYSETIKKLKQKQLKSLKERQLVLDMWRKGESKPGPVVYSKQELSEFF